MLSIADIMRWFAGKAFATALLFLVLGALTALWTYAPDWSLKWKGAGARAAEVKKKIAELPDVETHLKNAESALESAEKSAPNWLLHPIDRWTHRQKTAAARKAVELARKTRDALNLEIVRLREATEVPFDRFRYALTSWLPNLFLIIGTVIFGPIIWRCFAYFLFAPLAGRAPPIQLIAESVPGSASAAAPARSLPLQVLHGETFYFRPACVQQRRDAATGSTWARFPYSPLVTSAARLFGLTHVRAESSTQPATVVLGSGDPDVYFTVIEMRNHPGFVLHPRHIVGLSHGIGVRTRWQIWRWHALLTGQVRYILFHGTGSVILQGTGGVLAESGAANPSKIEASAVAGFDSRASYATTRTEQSLGYVLGNVALMDDQFTGPFLFLREIAPHGRGKNLIHRTFGAVWSAIGKLLGF